MIIRKSKSEIELMRSANQYVAEGLSLMAEMAAPGVSTIELDEAAARMCKRVGVTPTFLGYLGYPRHICASINDIVVHGIPRPDHVLEDGDILSLDFGVTYKGFVGDSARTILIGEVSDDARALVERTRESLDKAIEKMVPGNRLGDIGATVQGHVTQFGYSVVEQFVGHGIGRAMHEEPQVPNYGRAGQGLRLKAGMVLAVEPMINIGGKEVRIEDDGWTAVTRDSSLSAHFEHSIAITESGPVVLSA